ncbi:MAG TPA: hypothetical protein VKR21_13610 [Solirubrobacteraceae bacterium]|nr:hypothetical protein [Solirubrobacteraceae bacterium]
MTPGRLPALLALAACLLAIAAALSGCGALAAPSPKSQPTPAVAEAQTRHEYPSPASRQSAPGGWSSPVAAVTAFARTYTNWDAHTVVRQMRGLAARSVGQARAAVQLAAAETSSDYELRQGGIANHGTVEAVAALAGGQGRYVVVTRESTTATATAAYQGLAPAWHVTIATVVLERPGLWVVSGWEPQS